MDDLSRSVAAFLFTFNEIEAQTYVILDILPEDYLVLHCKKLDQFNTRNRFIQALLRSSQLEKREELIKLLEDSIELSGYRNKLAHNPIRIDVYMNEEGDLLTTKELYNSKSGTKMVQILEQLSSKTKKSERIFLALLNITSSFDNDA
jgi:hypothetical protein